VRLAALPAGARDAGVALHGGGGGWGALPYLGGRRRRLGFWVGRECVEAAGRCDGRGIYRCVGTRVYLRGGAKAFDARVDGGDLFWWNGLLGQGLAVFRQLSDLCWSKRLLARVASCVMLCQTNRPVQTQALKKEATGSSSVVNGTDNFRSASASVFI
jgi:hypothetical protein